MNTREVDLNHASAGLTEVVEHAIRSGEEVVLTREGEAVAKIVPLGRPRPARRFGSARGQIAVPDDFDAPLEDFRDYM